MSSRAPSHTISRPEILTEAIHATGGPASDSLGTIKNYVDDRYPHFAWRTRWFDEINAAKTALRVHYGFSGDDNLPMDSPSRTLEIATPAAGEKIVDETETRRWTADDLRSARECVERIGDGDVAKTRERLDYFGSLGIGNFDRLTAAVQIWSDLLDAVGGDANVAANVVDVLEVILQPSVKETLPMRRVA